MEKIEEEKTRKKQMLILAALIVLGIWILLLVSINNGHASVGICAPLSTEDTAVLSEYGPRVFYSTNPDQRSALNYRLMDQSFTAVYATWLSGGAFVQVWHNPVANEDWAHVSGFNGEVSEGCDAEGKLYQDSLQWMRYILYGIFAAWAFVIGIHTVNS